MSPHSTLRLAMLCGVVTVLAACSSKADRIESGLAKGAEYVRTADWDKANVEMRNVLQIDPKNAQAYYLAGQIAESKGEVQRAYQSYLKAVELKPDHLDAKVGLARIYMLANRLDESEKALAETLAAQAEHLGARTLKAALAARRGDVPGAIEQAKVLIATQPSPPVEASLLLAGLFSAQGDGAAALSVVEAALKAQPKNLGLLQVGAQLTASSSDATLQKRAGDFFLRATQAAPKNNDLWNAWAVHLTRRNELDGAEKVLRDAIRAQPDDSQRTLVLLDFLASKRGKDVAEKEFLAAIAAKPKEPTLRFGLVNLYRSSQRQADARRVLQEIIDTDKDTPSGLGAKDMLAADLLGRGRVAEAGALVDEVLKASPRDGAALVMRGRMRLAAGDARNAVIDLRSAVRDQPGSAEVAGLLAQAHRRAGEAELAREVLSDAVKFKPDSAELHLLLAADMADAKDYKAAAAEIDEAIKVVPDFLRAHDMKAQLALAQKDRAGAEAVYVAFKTRFPKEPAGFMKLGQLYAEQKKFDAALKEYDAATRLAPKAPAPALSALGVLLAQRRFDEAHKRVEALAAQEPTSPLPYRLRAELAVAKGDLPLAEASYLKFIEFAPDATAAYQGLAMVKVRQGGGKDVDAALAVLDRGEQRNPGDAGLLALRAEWLTRANRIDEAIAVYEQLLKRAPDDKNYANNMAYLLVDIKGDPASLARAQEITAGFDASNNPGYLDTFGWTRYKLARYDEAVSALERAAQRSPETALYQLHLGMALYKKGDTERAQPHLKKAIGSKTVLPGLDEARKLVAMN